jgi:small subunit ribosomal protein S5
MQKRDFKKRRPHMKEPKEFEEQVIQIDRVTKVVKGGRRLRFRATVAIGNKKGKVGIGIGKSNEVTGAIQKGIAKAKKCMITVVLDGSTIPHDIKNKYKSSIILLLPAAPGTGIIAGGTIRKVLELTGIKDILSKSYGTTNKVNNTKGIFEALGKLRKTPFMEKKAAAANKAREASRAEAQAKAKERAEAKAKAAPAPKEDDKKDDKKKEEPKKEEPKKPTNPKE